MAPTAVTGSASPPSTVGEGNGGRRAIGSSGPPVAMNAARGSPVEHQRPGCTPPRPRRDHRRRLCGRYCPNRMDLRRVAVLDLSDALVGILSDLTEASVALVDEGMDSDLPSVLADGFGLEALDRGRASAISSPWPAAGRPRPGRARPPPNRYRGMAAGPRRDARTARHLLKDESFPQVDPRGRNGRVPPRTQS
jgi:hypothetical protein